MKENRTADQGKYKDKMLTYKEAAAYLRIGNSTIYEWVRKNIITCHRHPTGGIRFNVEDLDAFLDNGKVPVSAVK
jgi:excisionase family DNA binding protein